uniref:Peptidase S72 domain-containing protein n=1 Tax=Clytia hemisphaerica TaxID=252671 RepID=A0A7M5XQ64_9CNID
ESGSWINLVSDPYRIIAFPTEEQWRQHMEKGYRYKLEIRDSKTNELLGSPHYYNFKIEGTPKSDGLTYTMTLITSAKVSTMTEVRFINEVWSKLDSYMGGVAHLQHIAIKRTGVSVGITWFNCSLPTNCESAETLEVKNKLSIGNTVNEGLKTLFGSEYQIQSISTTCSDSNPIVQPKLNLTIPLCGCYVYQLPDQFAVDEKDGQNLDIELLAENGVTRLTRTSWVVYRSSTRTIEAIPDASVISLYNQQKGYVYILKVMDTTGKFSTSKVTIRLNVTDTGLDEYLTYTFSFQSSYPVSFTYVDLKKTFLRYFVREIKPGQQESIYGYQVLSLVVIEQTRQQFMIKIKDCSVTEYTCPTRYQDKLQTSDTLVSSGSTRFIQQMSFWTSGKITISIGDISKTMTTRINQPPIFANTMKTIDITYCRNGGFDIPPNSFRDENPGKISYKLYQQDGTPVAVTNWVNLVGNRVYVSPLTSVPPNTYTYKLEAIDECDLKADTDLVVRLSGDKISTPYSLIMQFHYKNI